MVIFYLITEIGTGRQGTNFVVFFGDNANEERENFGLDSLSCALASTLFSLCNNDDIVLSRTRSTPYDHISHIPNLKRKTIVDKHHKNNHPKIA